MNKNIYGKEVWRVDSTVVIVDIFFELTNTVFVNSTNIYIQILSLRGQPSEQPSSIYPVQLEGAKFCLKITTSQPQALPGEVVWFSFVR